MTPVRAVIDLGALRHNLATLRACAPTSRLTAVVKADAYGHGAVPVARALGPQVDGFAVARLDEALELREAGVTQSVMVLEGVFSARESVVAHRAGLELVVHDTEQLRRIQEVPPAAGAVVWVKFDTGMHRLGLDPTDAAEIFSRLRAAAPGIELRVMTHLACADEPNHPMTRAQLDVFEAARGTIAAREGGRVPLASIGNSAGVLAEPRSRADWVRPGLALYGAAPLAARSAASLGLRPVMTLETRILAFQSVATGQSVGYGASWRASRESRVAIAGIGYADGLPRGVPSGTPVTVWPSAAAVSAQAAVRVPIVGRVSMDLIALDVTEVPALAIGDRVVVWGEGAPIEGLADAAGTLAYELLCRVAPRVPRTYRIRDRTG